MLGGGIFLSIHSPPFIPIVTLGIFLLLLVFYKWKGPAHLLFKERVRQLLTACCFVGLGISAAQIEKLHPHEEELECINCQKVECQASLIAPVKSNDFGRKVMVDIEACYYGTKWHPMEGKVMLYLPKSDSQVYKKYDQVQFKGYLTTLNTPYPSYLKYLQSQGIFHASYGDEVKKIGRKQGIALLAYDIQQAMAAQVDKLFSDTEKAGLMKAMMLGERSDLDRETRDNFAQAGISHVLAISGMHIGIIFLILDKVLFFFSYLPRGYQVKQLVILLLLLGFMLLTGGSPAVVRATLMFAAILVSKMSYQRYQSLNIVSLTGIVQLLLEPSLAMNLGFQLSYAAVLSLVILYPHWEKHFGTGVGWKDALSGWIGVSLIATLATTPLIVLTFHQFPTYFLLSNILVSLPVSLMIWLGFLTVILAFVSPINALLAWASGWVMDLLLFIIKWINELPHGLLHAEADLWRGALFLFVELLLAGLILYLLKAKLSLIPLRRQA